MHGDSVTGNGLGVIAASAADDAVTTRRGDSESSSTSRLSSRINYEVFLNFRGLDTRKEFTDLLHERLQNAGIKVFRDNENLYIGEEIIQGLKDAIKRSRISIAIFSRGYASSYSCLTELVQMWECKELYGQTIIPIFYDVSPHEVKNQAGHFATSFEKHEKVDNVDSNTIKTWRKTLGLVGGLRGFERQKINEGHVSILLKEVLTLVRRMLKKDDQVVTDKLVGIDLPVQETMRKLGVVYSDGQAVKVCGEDVRVIAIGGMPGIGKTTIAKVVFNKIHSLFDGCSFLQDISSKEVMVSQEWLISDLQNEKHEPLRSSDDGVKIIRSRFSRMKVLIVLDGVREANTIKALVGKLTWFGPGSRIIVTTDREDVFIGLEDEKAVEKFVVKPMEDYHALQLFRKHAFQGDALRDVSEYDHLSIGIVRALGGHPLAIELWAGYLRHNGEEIEIWRETSVLLKKNRRDGVEKKVKDAFMASYNSLDDGPKKIFLDVACFLIGKDWRIARYMWTDCDYSPAKGLKLLREMYLLEVGENNELRMHDVLRNFGRELVDSKDLHERSLCWKHSDAISILRDGKGTGNVECISFTVEEGCPVSITGEELDQMLHVRFLRLDRANIQGTTKNHLPNLRWLEWRACRLISELGSMHLKKLVILDLSWSPITGDLQVCKQIMKAMEELKVLNLQGCKELPASLNFSAPTKLERLILEDCTQLAQIGPFIKNLRKLRSLNLRKCSQIKQLPQELGCMKDLEELLLDETGIRRIHFQGDSLESLEILSARGCEDLKDISIIGSLRELKILALDGSAIIDWDTIFEFPPKLQRLSLRKCSTFSELPQSIGDLTQLEVMDLSDTGIKEMPPSVQKLRKLKMLKIKRTHLGNFPEEIVKLEQLEEIDFSRCRSMVAQDSCDISGLTSLRILRLSSCNVARLPRGICNLPHLQTLDVRKCEQLEALPELPSSLVTLCWGSKIMEAPKLRNLTSLKELYLNVDEQPGAGSSNQTLNMRWIMGLTSLETLELSLPNVTNLPGDFHNLTRLRELTLSYMEELDLTQLPSSSSLWTLRLKRCKIPEPNFSGLIYLSELEVEDCDLVKIDGLKDLQSLEVLKISQRNRITDLNGLKGLPRLRNVKVFPFDAASLSELRERGCEVDTCG